jgi:hypothetical protein
MKRPGISKRRLPKKVGLVSEDDSLYKLVRGVARLRGATELRKIQTLATQAQDANLELISDIDTLIVDIDQGTTRAWMKLFARLAAEPKRPMTVVLYNPSNHRKTITDALKRLAAQKKFAVFAKPIDVMALQQTL